MCQIADECENKTLVSIIVLVLFSFSLSFVAVIKVLELSDNIRKQIPENIDFEQTIRIMVTDTSPLKTVLLQEVGYCVDMNS